VLRPQEREDGELEVVRLAAEQVADTFELPAGKPEGEVKRLFRDPLQEFECNRAVRCRRRLAASG
jgi:hypothetical protein